jgi:glycosyltransferase involved in cell wall biosynthesis
MPREFVSVVVPTYNRRDFLPMIIHQYNQQTYPKELRELVIMDDSPTSNEDLIPKNDPSIRYIYLNEKITLGEKRNRLNNEAKGDIIVCFDDDDYQFPERITHSVYKLKQEKSDIAGCTSLDVYYTDIKKAYRYGPFGNGHGTNGTFAYTRKYVERHKYDNTKNAQEEPSFTNNFTEKMTQLDPLKTILCIAHDSNTYDKKNLLKQQKLEQNFRLNKLIKDKVYLEFFNKLCDKMQNKVLEKTNL